MARLKLVVTINGTSGNPWHKMGLTQNPFPQIPRAEFTKYMQDLARLDSEPILNVSQIKEILVGWSPEFIDICCSKFEAGERVRFEVTYG